MVGKINRDELFVFFASSQLDSAALDYLKDNVLEELAGFLNDHFKEAPSPLKTFDGDMELVDFMVYTHGDWPFGSADRRRCGKLERSSAFPAMKAASEARDRASREWIKEFGSKAQKKSLERWGAAE